MNAKWSWLAISAALILPSVFQARGSTPNALVQYTFEVGTEGSVVTSIENAADPAVINPLNVYEGTGVTLSNSATSLLGLAGYYDNATSTEMAAKSVLNIGAQTPFAVSGWLNPLASAKGQVIGGNRYNTTGWSLELSRCNSTTGNNTLSFLYGKGGPVVSFDVSNVDNPGSELGWFFFTVQGYLNDSGAFELALFIGDTDGNLTRVSTTSATSGGGDVTTDTTRSGFGADMLRATSYPTTSWEGVSGYMDELTIWNGSFDVALSGNEVTGGALYEMYSTAIPEPSVSAVLLGIAGLLWVRRRHR